MVVLIEFGTRKAQLPRRVEMLPPSSSPLDIEELEVDKVALEHFPQFD